MQQEESPLDKNIPHFYKPENYMSEDMYGRSQYAWAKGEEVVSIDADYVGKAIVEATKNA